ncbi:Imm40 family immunity protein [Pseudoxanthomonas sp. UTMC 1351]|uniref:Imm40 family immunity protein n=1 Tax=Pseudoxanthomonas sp. UTMC 1351 TaxID=2695853 RepID=UPI0034CD1EE3
MEIIWSTEVDGILAVGRSLVDIGVRNWALERRDALEALDKLSDLDIAVLGGDVYLKAGSSLTLSYDNWYCNCRDAEPQREFVVRSIAAARSYISRYKSESATPFFALVPKL